MAEIRKYKKIPEGTQRMIDGRMHTRHNGEWIPNDSKPMDVRNAPNGGRQYRRQGDKEWRNVDDSKEGIIAQDADVNTRNSDAIADRLGARRPRNAPSRSQDKKIMAFGSNGMVGKPWSYKSPLDYLKAYALRSPKTKAGRLLFDTINTTNWFVTWSRNKSRAKAENEQIKAVDDGYEDAMRNVYEWTDNIDPSQSVDSISSVQLNRMYKELNKKLSEMEDQYEDMRGRTDPDALRFKTEYKAYRDMYGTLDRMARDEESRRRAFDESERRANEQRDRARQKAEEIRQRYKQNNP
jgi:hypothetical protein